MADIIVNSPNGYLLAPSTINLAGASVELVNLEEREFKLAQALDSVQADFDYIIIDGPPSLGLLTINSLVAATHLLIPVQAGILCPRRLKAIVRYNWLDSGAHLKPNLGILGAVGNYV